MKRLILIFLLGLFYISVFGQYKFSLDIKTESLSNKKIYLAYYGNQNWDPIKVDSFVIMNGQHTITGEVKQPSNVASFSVSHNTKEIRSNFVLDSGKNHLSLELPIQGSRTLTLASDARGNFIFNDLDSVFSKMLALYPGTTRVNGYLKIPAELDKQIKQAQLKRLETYPNDFASLVSLYRISRTDASPNASKDNLATFAKLNDNLKNTALGKQLYDEQTSLIKNKIRASAGNQVPVFQIKDISNKLFSNKSLKGQPYMIVFSATWCGPCQRELPTLKRLYQTYKERGLKVIYFNDDDNVIRWKEHVSKNKLTWINVSEKLKPSQSKIPKSFGVYAIPTCFVINKNGSIIYNSDESDVGISDIETFIKKAISN